MSEKTRALMGLMLIVIGLFYNQISDFIIPEPKPNVNIIDIDQPSQDIISVTSPIANLVTDEDDRLKLCCFNKIFADRVTKYPNIEAQQINDLYVLASKNYFGTTLRNKYNGFSIGLKGLFTRVIGTQQHVLSDEEKAQLNEVFLGLAWSLNN